MTDRDRYPADLAALDDAVEAKLSTIVCTVAG